MTEQKEPDGWDGLRVKAKAMRYSDKPTHRYPNASKFLTDFIRNMNPRFDYGETDEDVFAMVALSHDVGPLRLVVLKAMEEFAAQSPVISRERLVEIIKNNVWTISTYGIEGVSHAADAILSELGKQE